MRSSGEQLLQQGDVLFRHIDEGNPHAEVRIRNANLPLGLDRDAIDFKFQIECGSGRVGGLSLHVTAVEADLGEACPRVHVASFFANLGAASHL